MWHFACIPSSGLNAKGYHQPTAPRVTERAKHVRHDSRCDSLFAARDGSPHESTPLHLTLINSHFLSNLFEILANQLPLIILFLLSRMLHESSSAIREQQQTRKNEISLGCMQNSNLHNAAARKVSRHTSCECLRVIAKVSIMGYGGGRAFWRIFDVFGSRRQLPRRHK